MTRRRWATTRWSGYRYRKDVGFERRCSSCSAAKGQAAWWPVDLEFWKPTNLTACRACLVRSRKVVTSPDLRYVSRTKQWERQCPNCDRGWQPLDPEHWGPHTLTMCRECFKERQRVSSRASYWANHERALAVQKAYRERNGEYLSMKRHQRYISLTPEQLAERFASIRAWKVAHADLVREQNRRANARLRERRRQEPAA